MEGCQVDAELLLDEISEYCQRAGMSESTFGRRAVNDGKLVSRLRLGRTITANTADRVHSFMTDNDAGQMRTLARLRTNDRPLKAEISGLAPIAAPAANDDKSFRF